jgi:hypothetical protein
MNHWMFNCKEVTRRVSDSMDRRLPLLERMAIRIHLMMCRYCTRYKKQLAIMRQCLKELATREEGPAPDCRLSQDVKNRMKAAIRTCQEKTG